MVYMIGMHLLKKMLPRRRYMTICVVVLFFLIMVFIPLGFSTKGFNEATKNTQMRNTKVSFPKSLSFSYEIKWSEENDKVYSLPNPRRMAMSMF
uniref:Uncharacterized protein n=1 Tax=Noccaea caerulescens TaxID=107243 RepID=A0A1J3JS97_NOCCA